MGWAALALTESLRVRMSGLLFPPAVMGHRGIAVQVPDDVVGQAGEDSRNRSLLVCPTVRRAIGGSA